MRRMRILFVGDDEDVRRANNQGFEAATSRAEAERLVPWAAELVRDDGGWLAFESVEDARIWQQQT